MNISVLSFKNATGNIKRSLTLGFFIFAASFTLILSNIFVSTAKNKIENVITGGICGHIQLRSANSREQDMAAQYANKWDSLKPIKPAILPVVEKAVEKIVADGPSEADCTKLVRRSVKLNKNGKSQELVLFGLYPGMETYRDAFLLSEGRYLDPEGSGEVLLTEEQAAVLGVRAGDFVTATTKNRYGLNSTCELKVVGVGNFVMLSLFSFNAGYAGYGTVQKLAAYTGDEVTDMIIFLPDKAAAGQRMQELADELKLAGIEYTISKDEKITSEDIKARDISFEDDKADEEGLVLSTFEEMGETYRAAGETMFIVLNILSVFLLVIVSILIFNLVYMTGIERYREIGTLRAVGFSKKQVIFVFMTEIISVSFISSIAGALLCTGLVMTVKVLGMDTPVAFLRYIVGEKLGLDMDVGIIAANIAIILAFSVIASFMPAYRACSIDPAQAVRQE
jgi:putative ABC transport system permease protein